MNSYLEIEGKKYLSAKNAAKIFGYTSDYVGQLCRSKKINGKLVGRSWYVLENEIIEHKDKSDKNKKTTTTTSNNSASEERTAIVLKDFLNNDFDITNKSYEQKISRLNKTKNISIVYHKDDRDLLPALTPKVSFKKIDKDQSSKQNSNFNVFSLSPIYYSSFAVLLLFFVFSRIGVFINLDNSLKTISFDTRNRVIDYINTTKSNFKDSISRYESASLFGANDYISGLISSFGYGSQKKISNFNEYCSVDKSVFVVNTKKDISNTNTVLSQKKYTEPNSIDYLLYINKSISDKFEDFKNNFVSSPYAPNVNRYYITKQNDVIIDRLSNRSTTVSSVSDSWSVNGSGFLAPSSANLVYIGQASSTVLSANYAQFSALRLDGSFYDINNSAGVEGMVLQTTGTSTRWVSTSTLGIISGSTLSGGIDGYVARWTSPTTLATGSILDDGTYSGVNATSSSANFLVQGTGSNNPFEINNSSGGRILTVTSSGFVSIGTTTIPSVPLEVYSSDETMTVFSNPSSALNNGRALEIQAIGEPYARTVLYSDGKYAVGSGSATRDTVLSRPSANTFKISSDGSDGLASLLVTGNIGIATTSPYRTLSVSGSGVFTGGDVLASTFTATSSITTPSITLSSVAVNSLLSTNSSGLVVATSTPTFGNFNATSTTATSTILGALDITKGLQLNGGYFFGAGLTGCSTATDKLIWNSTTGKFGCGFDAGSAGTGITAFGAQYSSFQTGASQTLATSSDTNIGISIISSGDTHTFTPSWIGTLSSSRGGTGLSSINANEILIGNSSGTGWTQIATSSLGLQSQLSFAYPLLNNSNIISLAFGTTTANSWSALQQFNAGASTTQFTSTGNTYLATLGGNVGIGTTTPVFALNISTTTRAQIALSGSNTDTPWTFRSIGNNLYIATSSPTTFATSTNTALSILSSGNVGIGTTVPTEKLSIVGGNVSIGSSNYFISTSINGSNNFTINSGSNASIQLGTGGSMFFSDGGGNNRARIAVGSGDSYFTIGNFGIGTTTPGSLLSIGNTNGINFSTATSTFSSTGGINLSSGCFAIGGNCLTNSTSFLDSGTTGQVAYFSGTNTAIGTSSLFIAPSGNVGVGSTNPPTPFYVSSAGTTRLGINSPSNTGFGLYTGSALKWSNAAYQANGSGNIDYTIFNDQTSFNAFSIDGSTSFVGIGTTSPFAQLSVNSTAGSTSFVIGSSTATNFIVDKNGNVGIGTSNPTRKFEIVSNAAEIMLMRGTTYGNGLLLQDYTAGSSLIGYNGSTYNSIELRAKSGVGSQLNLATSGNIGIATTSPYRTLSVSGSGVFTGGDVLASTFTATSSITTPSITLSSVAVNSLLSTNSSGLVVATSTPTFGNFNATSTTATSTIAGGFIVGSDPFPKFMIDGSTGNIGIGTTNPTSLFNVQSGGTDLVRITDDAKIDFPTAAGVASPSITFNGSNSYSISGSGSGVQITGGASYLNVNNSNIYTMANFGIGTTTPGSLLSIGNTNGINFSTATSTFSSTGGINLSSGCFAIGGNCLTNSTSFLDSGTTGQVAYFSGTNTAIGTSSLFIAPSGNVGVGTTTVALPLYVYQQISSEDIATFDGLCSGCDTNINILNRSISNSSNSGINFQELFSATQPVTYANISGVKVGSLDGALRFRLNSGGSIAERMRLTSAGFLGIGTTTPAFALNIATTTRSQLALSGSNTDTPWTFRSIGNNLYIATSSPTTFATSTNTALSILSSGNVGIGTNNPQSRLDVGNGTITGGIFSTTYRNVLNLSGAGGSFAAVDTVFPGGSSASPGSGLFRSGQTSVLGTNDIFFQAIPLNTSGYGYLESWNAAGMVVGTGATVPSNAGPIIFRPGRVEAMRILYDGSVGIGTTTPGSLLSIGNTNGINFSTATSTFSSTGGINLSSGCFAIGGNCLTNSTSFLDSGTTGQVAYFSGTNTAIGTSSLFIAPSGNVGVGTTGPVYPLSVESINTAGSFSISSAQTSINSAPANIILQNRNTTLNNYSYISGTDSAGTSLGSVAFKRTGSSLGQIELNVRTGAGLLTGLSINNQTFVGIGTSTPLARLSVVGTTCCGNVVEAFDVSSTTGVSIFRITKNDTIGISTTTPYGILSINPNNITGPSFVIGSSTATNFIVTNGGNVGVGTSNPTSLFNVQSGGTDLVRITDDAKIDFPTAAGVASPSITFNGSNSYSISGSGSGVQITGGASYLNVNNSNIYTMANFGIGTTTPGSLLSIGNTNGINFSTATSTFSSTGGINLANGCFAIGGNCLTNSISFLDSGTTGQVAYFSGTNTAIGTSSLFIAPSGNVGVGTSTPQYILSSQSLTAPQLSLSAGAGIPQWTMRNAGGNLYFATTTVAGNSTTTISALTILNNGNVGISSSSPSYKLSVIGNGSTNNENVAYFYGAGQWPGYLIEGGTSASGVDGLKIRNSSGYQYNIGLGGSATSASIGSNNLFIYDNNVGVTRLVVNSSGNIGISTTSPYRRLSVSGSGVFTGGDVLASTFTATSSITTPSITLSSVAVNSLLSTNSSGLVVATSTPTFGNFNATSTTATSTIAGGFIVGSDPFPKFMIDGSTGNIGIGTTNPTSLFNVQSGGTDLVRITDDAKIDFPTAAGVASPSITFNGSNSYSISGSGSGVQITGGASYLNVNNSNIYTMANFGIGTTTPGSLLSIGNTNGINFSTATSTFSSTGGINLSSGCFAIGGVCIGGSGSSASSTLLSDYNTFTNNNNFIGNVGISTTSPFAQLSVNSIAGGPAFVIGSSTATSFIVDKNGNVGVNIKNPEQAFHVSTGYARFDNTILLNGNNASGYYTGTLSTYGYNGFYNGGDVFIKNNFADGTSVFNNSGIKISSGHSFMRFSDYGFAGINTNDSDSALKVVATSSASKSPIFTVASSSGVVFQIDSSGNVGLGTTTSYGLLSINPNNITGPSFVIGSSTATNFIVTNRGNVGIGSTSPYAKLSILGTDATGSNDADPVLIVKGGNGSGVSKKGSLISLVSGRGGDAGAAGNGGEFNIKTGDGGDGSIFTGGAGGNINIIAGNGGIGNTVDGSGGSILINPGSGSVAGNVILASTNGMVGVATTTPWRTLSVEGNVAMNGLTASVGAGSLCLSSSNEVVYNAGSDNCLASLRSTKHNITDLGASALSYINALEPVEFVYNEGDQRKRYGFIAEDVSLVDDTLATRDANGNLSGVDDRAILSVVVKAIQESDIKVNILDSYVDVISARTSQLESLIGTGNGVVLQGSNGAKNLVVNDALGNNVVTIDNDGSFVQKVSSSTAFLITNSSSDSVLLVDSNQGRVSIGTSTTNYDLTIEGKESTGYIASINNTSTSTDADGLLISLGIDNSLRTTDNYFVAFADNTGAVGGKIQGGNNSVAYTTHAADLAEYFHASDINDLPKAGEIIALDISKERSVKRIYEATSTEPFGIVSTNPGFIGNGPVCFLDDEDCEKNYAKYNVLVALAGQVPVRVSMENGPINVGDYLTLSTTTPGVATKLVGSGYIVGTVISNVTTINSKNDSYEGVYVYVKSGWRDAPESNLAQGEIPSKWKLLFDFLKSMGLEIGNGFVKMANLIVKVIVADKVETKELCIEDLCIDKESLQALLIQSQVNGHTNTNTDTQIDTNSSSTPVATNTDVENGISADSTSSLNSNTENTVSDTGDSQNNTDTSLTNGGDSNVSVGDNTNNESGNSDVPSN